MPAFIAPLVGFIIGIGLAWAAADRLAKGGSFAPRPLAIVILFAALLYTPACAYFLAFEGDWAYAYFIDTRKLPSAIDLALAILNGLSVIIGYMVAAPKARARRLVPLLSMAAAPALAAAIALIALKSRLSVQASFAQFHGDFGTKAVSGSALGYGLLWMNAVIAIGVAWNARVLRRAG